MPVPERVRSLSRQTIRDRVYETLRDWIIAGTLYPGEILKDNEVAQELGVSRTPVREALQRLEHEGLVQTESNRWTRVTPIDLTETGNTYEVIRTLEQTAILAAGPYLTTKDFKAMDEANARIEDAARNGRAAEASEADARLHNVYVHACGNRELIRILDDLRLKLRRVEINYFKADAVALDSLGEHRQVIEMLRRSDYERAATAIRTHWDGARARLSRSIEPEPDGS